VLVGNPRFLEERRIDLSAARAALARADGEGATPLLVAVDSRVVGLIAARDRERPGAREAVAALRSAGFEVVLISGDRRAAAEATARRLGIETALSEVPPIEKAAAVRRLSAGDRVVAMVGDGVNDAPALAEASVGIAVRGATDVATAAAGIALARDEVARVPEALSIARRTLRTIRQNLFLAFVYNTLAIPVAAAGLLDPMIAAAAMSLSSVSVVGNSLRLRGARLA
jgi:Cu+-exporting ATPase